MKIIQAMLLSLAVVALSGLGGGCATYRSVDSATADSPKIFSGTRMDIHAIKGDDAALLKYNAEPPKYPWLDLPASFIMDIILLGITVPPATHEAVFND